MLKLLSSKFKMASHRQDIALHVWLQNKLSSDDPWSGSNLRSLLTQDVLRNIPECFHRLEPQVKIKLLMAFLHLPRRVLEETSADLCETLEIGSQDEDEWVRVICEILKYYPTSGMLNVHLEQASPVFAEVIQQLKQSLAAAENGSSLLPLECTYLNKMALHSVVGQQPTLPKHFTLRRKPKSAALRAELIQKASEALSTQKKIGTAGSSTQKLQSPAKKFEPPSRVNTRPINRPRISNSATPSRSIISAATLKQHGRTKLLDINEQPIGGGREVKRRKKLLEAEQAEEAKQKKATETAKTQEPATPEYAAGLQPLIPQTKATPTPSTPSTTATVVTTTPSYAVISNRGVATTPAPPAPAASSDVGTDTSKLSESTLDLKRELETAVEQQRQLMRERQQQKMTAAMAMPSTPASTITPTNPITPATTSTSSLNMPSGVQAPAMLTPSNAAASTSLQQQQQMFQQQQQQNKRQLTLSREQMLAAHEMFRNANRVSRAEKALILGFMAGARDKPFPNQGPIITIKLSENTENAQGADGNQQTLLVEMLFEMNYDTGHWRRLKRTRVVSKQNPGQPRPTS